MLLCTFLEEEAVTAFKFAYEKWDVYSFCVLAKCFPVLYGQLESYSKASLWAILMLFWNKQTRRGVTSFVSVKQDVGEHRPYLFMYFVRFVLGILNVRQAGRNTFWTHLL